MATTSPSTRPKARRRVRASSRAWVGCSRQPSPALITLQLTFCARRSAAPEAPWRTTSMSGFMAFSVTAVSIRVSPLVIEELRGAMLTVSAPSLLAAISKELWVRVELSKNRLTMVRPRRVASFLSGRWFRATKASARASRASASGRLSAAADRK